MIDIPNIKIAVDFDGTIVEHRYPEIGQLRRGAKEVMNELKSCHHTIIIWTCRYLKKDLVAMRDFLLSNGIPFDWINCNAPGLSFHPEPKIYADVYIDDRALGFPGDWFRIRGELLKYGVLNADGNYIKSKGE